MPQAMMSRPPLVWIDLDNSPHVPFFLPITRELEKGGCEVLLTARDCFQVCGLAGRAGLSYHRVGRHFGRRRLLKAAGTALRAAQLIPYVLRPRPRLAVSHGSRAQRLAAGVLGIPYVLITDYEHARWVPWVQPARVLVPEVIAGADLPADPAVVVRYPGIKEDVYVPDFVPDPRLPAELGLDPQEIVATIRPPAEEAHYQSPESGELFAALMEHLGRRPNLRLVVLPRTNRQADQIRRRWPGRQVVIPEGVVDGLNLIWHSDLVVSGGGTMNREAAALGVPVYSIFRGKTGAVDRYLETQGRLVLLRGPEDLAGIRVEKRAPAAVARQGRRALGCIVEEIMGLLAEPAAALGTGRIRHKEGGVSL